jgi:hypothetical protein
VIANMGQAIVVNWRGWVWMPVPPLSQQGKAMSEQQAATGSGQQPAADIEKAMVCDSVSRFGLVDERAQCLADLLNEDRRLHASLGGPAEWEPWGAFEAACVALEEKIRQVRERVEEQRRMLAQKQAAQSEIRDTKSEVEHV